MRLRNEFILHTDKNGTFLIPSGEADFSGVVRGNSSFEHIVNLLKEDTTEEEIVKNMTQKYDAPKEIIERDVKKVVENLHEIGAIID